MIGTLSLINNTLAYGDTGITSNPARRYVDWAVQRNIVVSNPKTESFSVDPGSTLTLFAGTRATSIANDTEFTVTLSTLASDRYRFTWTGGTAPVLRTSRGLNLSSHTVTVTSAANQVAVFTANAISLFSAVMVGDTLFIPGPTTGDGSSPFNTLNQGVWIVLAVATDGSYVQVTRLPSDPYEAIGETVSITAAAQVTAFSGTGVAVGDKVVINSGFVSSVCRQYSIVQVTPSWFEVVFTGPLPVGVTGTPGAANITFYNAAKRYIRIEADQECLVQLNEQASGSLGNRLEPWTAGDPAQTAFFEQCGSMWAASVKNLSSVPLNLLFISAE